MKKTHIFLLVTLGLMLLVSACSQGNLNLDPESRDFYETARLIMTKPEKDIFNHLPDVQSRKEFIQDFWDKRDPDPETEENEYRDEFYARIDYSNTYFREGRQGWKTDRGRIYIYFGPPDWIDQRPMLNYPEMRGLQIWIYDRYNFGIYFIDKRGDGSYTFDPYYGVIGNFFEAMKRAQMGLDFANRNLDKIFIDFKADYDDTKKEIYIVIPTKNLAFTERDRKLFLELDFKMFIYPKKGGPKQTLREKRPYTISEQELVKLDEIVFAFPFDLAPGKYYLDTLIILGWDTGKTRKIFSIKVNQ